MHPSDPKTPASPTVGPGAFGAQPRGVALVTAGPTEEPIDAVRFLGNRSSGRMGLAIADALRARGWTVTLALGPIRSEVPRALLDDPQVRPVRFRTSRELEAVLVSELPQTDLVVMAAAVADYRPRSVSEGKMRRSAGGMTIELEAVPDLLSVTRTARKPGSRVYGFALEPVERLVQSARDKLLRKDLDGIVANPLETMDAPDVDGTLFLRDGRSLSPGTRLAKDEFARWLAGAIT
jgi:phosphopantothenoylcysteine decarboxylase/phosphopantothenate--cysteine ligase